MKCTINSCKSNAVMLRKFEGTALCEKHFYESVEKRVRKTIRMNNLIEKNDRIAVALSGGKDSSLCLYLLKKIIDKDRRVELFAILIDEGIEGYRAHGIKAAKKLCKQLNIQLHIYSFKDEFKHTLDNILKNKNEDILACTYCGVFRRHLLNKYAKKLGATKLATGHNLDDEIQSIMANYIRGDVLRAARLGAKAFVVKDKRFVPRIKPLRNNPEKENALYAVLKKLHADFSECPYAEQSFRWDIRNLINELEAKHAGTKFSILKSFDRLLPELKKAYKNSKIDSCSKCGGPTSGKICKVCTLKEAI